MAESRFDKQLKKIKKLEKLDEKKKMKKLSSDLREVLKNKKKKEH